MSNGQNIFYNSKKSQKKRIYSQSEKNVKQINGNELENYMLSLYEYYINKIKKNRKAIKSIVYYIFTELSLIWVPDLHTQLSFICLCPKNK